MERGKEEWNGMESEKESSQVMAIIRCRRVTADTHPSEGQS